MNLFDTSQTSTLTQSALIPNQNQNGKVSALSYSAAMDIDTDLQHHHRPQTNSKMDSSPDTSQLAPVKPNEPETPASTPLVALAAKDRTPFSDRPKVEEAQQSSSQARKTPH